MPDFWKWLENSSACNIPHIARRAVLREDGQERKMIYLVVVLVIGLVICVLKLKNRTEQYAKNLAAATAPKPFGLEQLKAVAVQISLTAETVRAAIVAATVAGMKNCVAGDIKAKQEAIHRDIANANDRIRDGESAIENLKRSISRERHNIQLHEASDTYLTGIAAFLPPAPAIESEKK
jgi:cell division protein ZapA (FtsZ GTPase activity inhibitor)